MTDFRDILRHKCPLRTVTTMTLKREALRFFLIKPTDPIIFPSLFLSRNSTCFGQFLCPSSGVFHCRFGTGICYASLMTAFNHAHPGRAAWHKTVPNVQWKTPDDGQRNCPKHVEFLDKIKLGKISAFVGFILKSNLLRCTVTWT
jgi:hypothetical protein